MRYILCVGGNLICTMIFKLIRIFGILIKTICGTRKSNVNSTQPNILKTHYHFISYHMYIGRKPYCFTTTATSIPLCLCLPLLMFIVHVHVSPCCLLLDVFRFTQFSARACSCVCVSMCGACTCIFPPVESELLFQTEALIPLSEFAIDRSE